MSAAGVQATVGFNYRAMPAFTKLCQIVANGDIGRPTHARVHLLSDYAAHPLGLLSWRYRLGQGGHGVLGDLASHAVDLARMALGEFTRVVAQTATFIPERPVPEATASATWTPRGAE